MYIGAVALNLRQCFQEGGEASYGFQAATAKADQRIAASKLVTIGKGKCGEWIWSTLLHIHPFMNNGNAIMKPFWECAALKSCSR